MTETAMEDVPELKKRIRRLERDLQRRSKTDFIGRNFIDQLAKNAFRRVAHGEMKWADAMLHHTATQQAGSVGQISTKDWRRYTEEEVACGALA